MANAARVDAQAFRERAPARLWIHPHSLPTCPAKRREHGSVALAAQSRDQRFHVRLIHTRKMLRVHPVARAPTA
eukprot:6350434-Pyramimonas_sp.AAC.1